ncbi:hypothetical protein M8C21_011724 [Ambrosia artemisiifolia]|uniref:Uncharacterized protein n=1 Tax=Ambrosia artemisiifolia TaxID=4212 RepID=A0AAD5CBA9_AMBAR|nr:hypothetical protein M8C21_011724 [Ambrosia artemisiifolia]
MRKICILELLSAKKVRSFESVRDQESWNLVETMVNIEGAVAIILTKKIFTMMNVVVSRVAVGTKCKDQAMLIELIKQIEVLSGGFDVFDLFPSFKVLHLNMFIAGTDTSSVITEWAMFELMINPRVMHKLQGEIRRVLNGKKKVYESDIKDLDYLRLMINGTLRLHPHVPLIPREYRAKCEICGYNHQCMENRA